MKKLFTVALIACSLSVFGQNTMKGDNIIFSEDFNAETSLLYEEDTSGGWELPEGWTQEYERKKNGGTAQPPTLEWILQKGGPLIIGGGNMRKPEKAHSNNEENSLNNKNALLQYLDFKSYQMYLVSPSIDLVNTNKPMLKFWYSQYADRASSTDTTLKENFEIELYYRYNKDEAWTGWEPLAKKCPNATDDSEPWRCDSVMLPDSIVCGKMVQIGFLGITKKVGHGCCIDDVSIVETKEVRKVIGEITATHPTTAPVATSSTDNVIMRVRVNVKGNTGSLKLNSLTAIALQDANTDIKENGAKLFYTETESLNSPDTLGSTSIVDGQAVFSKIERDLPMGYSYLWIICDIKGDPNHDKRGHIIDMKIDTCAIVINGKKYPEPKIDEEGHRTNDNVELHPRGARVVEESFFIESFEEFEKPEYKDTIWIEKNGEFQIAKAIDPPLGGTNGGNPNPSYAHSGNWMLGTDITGLGEQKGNYEKNIGSNAYYIISDTFDCSHYKDIGLMFYRWLNVCDRDTAAVGISTDGGETWKNIWASSASISDKEWSYQYYPLDKVADRNPYVRVRFTLGPTKKLPYSGWNIDDVALVGTFIKYDAALTEIVAPNTNCGLDTTEITVRIKNVGVNDINAKSNTKDSLFVSFSIDGGKTWVTDTVKADIKRDAELLYTFDSMPDLSQLGGGFYNIVARVSLGKDNNGNDIDEDNRNDYAQKRIMSLPYIDAPYSQTFDSSGYWFGNKDIWQLGCLTREAAVSFTNSGTWQHDKQSGWKTKVVGSTYAANDSAWLETPCFSMSAMQRPIIEFQLKGETNSADGMAVHYSVNNGMDWKLLPSYPTSSLHPNWKWYNPDNIYALNSAGWSGNFEKWTTIKQFLPDDVVGADSVRFRFVFASGKTPSGKGFTINKFRLYESPIDVGIAEIVEPVDACELLKEQPITVAITNLGLRGIIPTDSIIASVIINDKHTLTDTLFVTDTLAVGNTILHTFSQTVDMWNKKPYRMTAYTQAPGDTMRLFINSTLQLSGVENDTFKDTANVLGEPQYHLGVLGKPQYKGGGIGTLDPEKTQLDGLFQTDSLNSLTTIPFATYQWYDNTKTAIGEYDWDDNGVVKTNNGTERCLYKLNSFPDGVYEYEYSIKVTNEIGCEASDTIKIIHSTIDVSVASVSGIADNDAFCLNNEFDDVKVTVSIENMSGEAPVTDDDFTIGICYEILDADSNYVTYTDTIVHPINLAPNGTDSFEHLFVRQPKFEYDGVQNIHFSTVISADLDPANNIDTLEVTVWPLPTVDLGDDIVESANPKLDSIVLKTDYIEGATYSWLNYDDSVKNTFMVTDSLTKTYQVSVTDGHNCAAVVDSVLVVTDDWVLAGLVSPTDQCVPQLGMDITVKLVNNSYNKYGAGYRIPVEINVDKEGIQRDTIVLSDSVFAHEIIEYKLKPKADLRKIGQFLIDVKIVPTYDINPDSLNDISEYVNVWGIPRIDLGVDTIFTLQPETVVLDAGSVVDGTDFSWYKWNKKSIFSDQTYNVLTTDNTCYVFAINEHGCYAEDQKIRIYDDYLGDTIVATDTVIIITTDVEFEEIISPKSSCDIASTSELTIKIRNNGLSAIKNGTELPVKVQINDEAAKTVTFKLKEQLKMDATTQLSMPFATNFESDKAYVVKTWLDWNLDHFNDNDTATITVSQFPHPGTFSLGDDIYTTQPDTIILHAPVNQYYYSWSNGMRGDTVDAIALPNIASTSYSVDIFNEYNCETADTMSVFTYDLEFSAFTNTKKENSNSCEPVEDAVVHGKISVKSLDEIPAGTNMTANFDFDGKNEKHDVTLVAPINKDKPYTFDFNTRISIPDTGNYVMKSGMTVNNLREADTANYKESEFRIGTYQIPFQDSVSTYDNVYTIDAGNMFSVFDWYTEQHHDGQTLTVVKSGDYKLRATDINGCDAEDSTYVLFIKPRYDIAKIEFDTLLCENASPSKISFYLKNTGNDIISVGSQAEISYMTNDSVVNNETFTFNKTIRENDSILVPFNKLADFANVGVDSVRIKAVIAGYEALKTVAVTTKPNPTVSLGDDFATTNTDTIITAGAGFAEYLWNTGETAVGISISKDGNYWVKVRDEFGCESADTVHAHFIPATITVSNIAKPESACGSITDQPIVFELINNSQTIVKKGQTIGVTCIIDSVQELRYTTTLTENFAPSAVFSDTIVKDLTISAVGVHTLQFITDVDSVINDTAEFTVEVYAIPEFKFGIDTIRTDEYPYVLAPAPMTGATYFWSTNETTESIEINVDGMYALTVTDSHNCFAFDSVYVKKNVPKDTTEIIPPKDTTGINDFMLSEVAVYPNPGKDVVNIDFKGASTNDCRIMVARVSGQIIYVSAQISDIMKIDVTDWAQGIYLIRITNGNNSRIVKFVKE